MPSNRTPRRNWRPMCVSALICALVFAIVAGLRQSGWLQYLELRAYDWFLLLRASAPEMESRVTIVAMTEKDIHDPVLGSWPITDGKLASLLLFLDEHQPRVIGVDIFRDIPVPPGGEQLDQLNRVLVSNRNIICIWKFGDEYTTGVPPPPALVPFPERVGFNDFPVDYAIDKVVRRALLYMDDGKTVFESFGLRLALHYLAPIGVRPEADPSHPELLRLGKTTFRPLERNEGCYVRVDAAGYQLLLDFRSPRQIPTYSLAQLASGQFAANAFRDKVVIVGISAESVKDYLVTPLRHNHRAIELQAAFVDQLLRAALDGQQPIASWDEPVELAWILAWCVLGGALGWFVHVPWRFSLWVGVSLVMLLAAAWGAFCLGWWIPLVWPALAFFPAAMVVTKYRSQEEKAQRGMMKQMFGKLVAPEVADHLWERRHEILDSASGMLLPQMAPKATVLFSDLKEFTRAAEGRDPKQLMEWLNDYMKIMSKVVTDHDGMVSKYIGDAIMAVFGVPEVRETEAERKRDAVNAVECALAMEQKLRELNGTWKAKELPQALVRIGIHTGELVAGGLGSSDRMEYTVLGDTVNVAARLEQYDKEAADPEFEARGCRILIGQATHDLLDGQFTTRLVGTMSLKGKRTPITVYRVVGKTNPNAGGPHAD